MNRTILNARVGSDGVLHVPLGEAEANREVKVTIEPAAPKKALTQAEYAAWVESMAGSWQGDFQRPPQGEFEERDPL